MTQARERERGEWVEGGEAGAASDCSAGCVGGLWRCDIVCAVVQRHTSLVKP